MSRKKRRKGRREMNGIIIYKSVVKCKEEREKKIVK